MSASKAGHDEQHLQTVERRIAEAGPPLTPTDKQGATANQRQHDEKIDLVPTRRSGEILPLAEKTGNETRSSGNAPSA